ncbi:MAG: PTS cellobiose transporter subunit IIC, partial [Lacticaseibacillus paracasei]
GLGICFYLLVRIRLIEKNQDRYLQQINKFAQSIQ